MKKYDAFLSHSSDDNDIARFIRGYFRSHNLYCWFDRDDIEALEQVADIHVSRRVKEAMDDSRHVLVIVSKSAIESKWVKWEVEYAAKRLEAGEIQSIVGIKIESTEGVETPNWLKPYRMIEVGYPGDDDKLRNLRERIGDAKPTYIDEVAPNFIKVSPVAKLTEYLEKCEGRAVRIWDIAGDMSVFILPALETLAERAGDAGLDCRLLLVDALGLPGSELEACRDARLLASNFTKSWDNHAERVADCVSSYAALSAPRPGLSLASRITPVVPAGRMTLFDDYGFFVPYTQHFDAKAPMFVLSQESPFYTQVSQHFDQTFEAARRHVA